jgi:DNA-binding NtrC family response regulator
VARGGPCTLAGVRVTRVTNTIGARPALHAVRMRVLAGPAAGTEVDVPAVGVVVGADPACDVVLDDASVSGRHCTIRPTERGFDVTDLGSKNGTLIDGVAIARVTAPAGAVLRLGRSLLQLLPADDVVEIPPSPHDRFGELDGQSLAMRQVFAILERAARSDASILFLGESGTGKELAARAVHDASPRAAGPFVVFDCGAATDTLIESDLFGHVRGAFTGAASDRLGAFAAAHGGTLFLDEIGDLPVGLQPKLLRMLEAGEVIPLGSRKPERYDVRVVAATHRDVFGEVARGGFRGDLYYRLAVVEVHLPPLRQRPSDIPQLVRLFLAAHGAPDSGIEGANLDRLMSYHWPGNVRELRNVVSRAVALSTAGTEFARMPVLLRAAAAGPDQVRARADRPFHQAKEALVHRFERDYLEDLLRQSGGSMAEAARRAGLERKYLYRLLDRVGVPRPRDT